MQIGRARPLCCFCWLFCCVVAAYVMLSLTASTLSVALMVAGTILALLLIAALVWRGQCLRLLYLAFVCLGLLLGLAASMYHESHYVRPALDYAVAHESEMVEWHGSVVKHETQSSYINPYGVRIDLPNGKQALLYLSVIGETTVQEGDRLCVQSEVCSVLDADEEAWRIRSLRSDGYLLAAYVQEADMLKVLNHEGEVTRSPFLTWQTLLSSRLSSAVEGEQGKLASALLLGTRRELSDQTVLDFRRAGASHLLALSGLHLSLIVLMISWLLRVLRCPYYLRMLLLALSAVAFLLLTGCSVSTVRATVMLLCLYLSRMRGAPHDALTPLSLFFTACLAFRPAWIYDVALWLTVLATLAVVEIVPALFQNAKEDDQAHKSRWHTLGHFAYTHLFLPLVGSCIVLLVLIVPMALVFGEISLMSPISNLLLTPLTAVVLALGLLALPCICLATFLPWMQNIGTWLAELIHYVADLILRVTVRLSDVRGALVSLRYDFVPYLLGILLLLMLAFLLLKWKWPKRFLWFAAGWTVTFAVCLLVTHAQSADVWQMTLTQKGRGELLTLNQSQTTVLCDMTDGSYTTYRELLGRALPVETTEIEALVLTHYHKLHISSVYRLLGQQRVRTLYLPLSMPDASQKKALQDEGIARSLAAMARDRRVEVRYFLPDEGVTVTDTLRLERLHYDMIKRSTHPTLGMCWQYRSDASRAGNRLVVMGASAWESKKIADLWDDVAACDALVLLNHGPVIKTKYTIPMWTDEPSVVVFANGNVAAALTATHETTEALSRAKLILSQPTNTKFHLP